MCPFSDFKIFTRFIKKIQTLSHSFRLTSTSDLNRLNIFFPLCIFFFLFPTSIPFYFPSIRFCNFVSFFYFSSFLSFCVVKIDVFFSNFLFLERRDRYIMQIITWQTLHNHPEKPITKLLEWIAHLCGLQTHTYISHFLSSLS